MIDITKNPYGKYNGNEKDYVLRALDRETPENKSYSWTTKLEEKFCQVMGLKYAIACNSGTSGLHAALFAAGFTVHGLDTNYENTAWHDANDIPKYNSDWWNIGYSGSIEQ